MNTKTPHTVISTHKLEHFPDQYTDPHHAAQEVLAIIKRVYNFTDEDLAVSRWRLGNFEHKVRGFLQSDSWIKKRNEAMGYSNLGPEKAADIDQAASDLLHAYRRALKVRTKIMHHLPGNISPEYSMQYYGDGWNKYTIANAYISHHVVQGLNAFEQCGLCERSALSLLGVTTLQAVTHYSGVQTQVHIHTAGVNLKQHIQPLQDPHMPWQQRVAEIRKHPQILARKLNDTQPPNPSNSR